MSAIFLSHSSRDAAFVDELRGRLVAQGHQSLFIDYDPEFGIPVGREWEKEIYQGLRSCQAVIVVCSAASMDSRWVFAEVTHAKALGKHIFPVRIDDCDVPAILADRQVLDLRARIDAAFQQLWRGLQVAGLDSAVEPDWDDSRSPYPGMVPFQEADARMFFGREDEIQHGVDLLNRLRRFAEARLAVVLGASGSGKSSLVRAGLLPRLRRDTGTWLPVSPIHPGRSPFRQAALAMAETFAAFGSQHGWREIQQMLRAAAASGGRPDDLLDLIEDLRLAAQRREATVLLVVDQAEELLNDDQPDDGRFLLLLRTLLEQPDCPLLVLCTLRSDYFGSFQEHPALHGLPFADLTVGPISRAGVVDVIEGPAEKAGLRLERGLTETMVDEVRSANALPLLAFSLRELYENRDRTGTLTIAVFRDQLGGLAGSVRTAAEAVFRSSAVSTTQVVDLREAFLAMVRINEQDRAASRPMRWTDAAPDIHPVLDRFVQARLLVAREEAGERILEVAHEALFSAWDRLMEWLEEDRERLRLRERLRQAAAEWNEQDCNPGLLVHRGTRLADTEELLTIPRFRLSDAERDYLAACVAEREAAYEAERRRSDVARVAVATDWLSRDVGIAALVLAEVQRPDDTPFAVARMNEAFARGFPIVERRTHQGGAQAVAFSPDGRSYTTASADRTAKIWRADGSGEPVVLSHGGQLGTVIYSPDGALIATTGNDGLLTLWRADGSGASVELADHGEFVAFSPDSERVMTAREDGSAQIRRVDGSGEPVKLVPADRPAREVDSWERPRHPAWLHRREQRLGSDGQPYEQYLGSPYWYPYRTRPPLFSPDGESVVTPSIHDVALVWRADGRGDPWVLRHEGSVLSATFSPDGRHILTASHDGTARLWPTDCAGPPRVLRHDAPVIVALFSSDGSRIATSAEDGAVRIWWTADEADPVVLHHPNAAYRMEFSPDGELLLTVDDVARLWRADGHGDPLVLSDHRYPVLATFSPDGERVLIDDGGPTRIWLVKPVIFPHRGPVHSAVFTPDGQRLLAVGGDHAVRIWPLDRRSRAVVIQHGARVRTTVFSPDGSWVATASDDATVKIHSVDGSGALLVLDHGTPVNVAAFSPVGGHLVTGADDGLTRVWQTHAPSEPVVLGPPGSYKGRTEVNAVAFSPDGGRVLSASGPVVRIWPAAGGAPLVLMGRHFGGYMEGVSHAWFAPDGRHIVAVGSAVRLWDAGGVGEPTEYRDGDSSDSFAASADGRRFVRASIASGRARVFSIDDISKPLVFHGPAGQPRFGPDATRIAANLTQISRDGTKVAMVSGGNAVLVWAADGTGEPSILKHEAAVRSVTFSPDGERVATVSEDGSARVWRADGTGEPLMLWHRAAVNMASFSLDGETIVTASDDGTARRWWVSPDTLWRSVRAMTSQCLTPEFRERYLGESASDAERVYRGCEQTHDRHSLGHAPTDDG